MSAKPVYQLCVSGAAAGPSVGPAVVLAAAAGREIAARGQILLTGATRGLPYAAAVAAQKAGGTSVGFSPAASRREHVKSYRLPLDAFDTVLYTGFGYTGRDLMLIRSADAVVMVGGRIGTLHELAISLEEHKPVGVLMGSHGMTDEVQHVLKAAKRARTGIIFDDDPARIVDRLLAMVVVKNRKLDHEAKV
jgi:uncharacterized protein (TIGR00725 family)